MFLRIHEMPSKETLSKEKAREFVKKNSYEIPEGPSRLAARCVDGRYDGKDILPPLARAGGDVGYLMAGLAAVRRLALELPADEVLDAIIQSIGGIQNFSLHTDTHAANDKVGVRMGCGHFKNASKDFETYGLTSGDIDFINESLAYLIQQGTKEIVLEGSHSEQAVFIINSKTHSLKPMAADGTQAFVYHKTLDGERIALIADILAKKLEERKPNPKEEDIVKALQEASDAQLAETVRRLADGLPVYTIDIAKGGKITFEEDEEEAPAKAA